MKITREKACQRLHHRVNTPLTVEVNGVCFQARDWSLGGLRVGNWQDFTNTRIGDHLECGFKLPFQGFDIAFQTRLEVVRLDQDTGDMAARFCGLEDRQTELMNHFVEQLIRGAMVPVDDTILRIDSPVTPVATTPDASPLEEVPVSRWPTRLIATSFFYVVLGCSVFYLLGTTIYDNFLSMQTSYALAEKPVEPIFSLADGRIDHVTFDPQQAVTKGQALFTIASPDLIQEIKHAKIRLERTKIELESLRKKHAVVVDIAKSHLTKEARFLTIEIDEKQKRISLATETLLALYEHKDDMQVASPSTGRIVKLLRGEGSLVQKGEMLAMFEHATDPVIAAYLTLDEARQLTLNDDAVVTSRFLDGSKPAFVGSIERLDATNVITGERIMRVELIVIADISNLPAGTPVEVSFPATRLNQWFGDTANPHGSVLTNRDGI